MNAPNSAAPQSLRDLLGPRIEQLLPTHLTTLDELLSREAENILKARSWALSRRGRSQAIGVVFLTALHKRMYENIWQWAGQLRRSNHPEGVRWPTVGIELNDLSGELRFWRDRKLYVPDEIALRFHHRLMRIRPWEGGNGTHARLAADAVVAAMDQPPFLWGSKNDDPSISRDKYSAALREADAGRFQLLRDFARSIKAQS